VIAVSPIIGTAAVSGPAANLMQAEGLEVSIAGVTKAYEDFVNVLLAHESDAEFAKSVKMGKVEIQCANILMRTVDDRRQVAAAALSLASRQTLQEHVAG
jgi:LPPG:FO 2-phospho-L-lactate transferase